MSHLWWVAILFAWMLRLGEATHPGPEPASVYPGLQIGCINPTGLLGKSQLVKDLPRGEATIWAVSESHLSTQGRRKCRRIKISQRRLPVACRGASAPTFQFSLSHRRQTSWSGFPINNAYTNHDPNMATRRMATSQVSHVSL